MKSLKRLWDYFFPKRERGFEWNGFVTPQEEKNVIYHEVGFFDPITLEEKFKKSDTLKDFIKKIDTHE